jgi:hypothetical protein
MLNVWVPVVIAGAALLVSIYSSYRTRQEAILSHRPYAFVLTFAYLDDQGRLVTDLRTVLMGCLNAPAQTIQTEHVYSVVRNTRTEEEVVDTRRDVAAQVLYPLGVGANQVTYKTAFDLESLTDAPDIQKLFRTIRMDYREISSDRRYRFEGKWEYDRTGRTWKPLRLTAN